MIIKIEKLLDTALEGVTAFRDYYVGLGQGKIESTRVDPATLLGGTAEPTTKTRKPRTPKALPAAGSIASAALPPTPGDDPFAVGGGTATTAPAAEAGPGAEEMIEAAKRTREMIGRYIRLHLNEKPSGLERAMAVIAEVLGTVKKFEEMTHDDHLKLIPRFEAELGKPR